MKNLVKSLLTQKNQKRTDANWATIYAGVDEHFIAICKFSLENEGIRTRTYNQKDSTYNAFGEIYLQVPTEEMDRAQNIVNSLHE